MQVTQCGYCCACWPKSESPCVRCWNCSNHQWQPELSREQQEDFQWEIEQQSEWGEDLYSRFCRYLDKVSPKRPEPTDTDPVNAERRWWLERAYAEATAYSGDRDCYAKERWAKELLAKAPPIRFEIDFLTVVEMELWLPVPPSQQEQEKGWFWFGPHRVRTLEYKEQTVLVEEWWKVK